MLARYIDPGHVALGAGPGALPLDERPKPSEAPPDGCAWIPRYAIREGRIVQSWAAMGVAKAKQRQVSKRRLYRALADLGVWDAVETWIGQSGLATDWALATTLDRNDPLLVAAAQTLAEQVGIQHVEEILDRCIAED